MTEPISQSVHNHYSSGNIHPYPLVHTAEIVEPPMREHIDFTECIWPTDSSRIQMR